MDKEIKTLIEVQKGYFTEKSKEFSNQDYNKIQRDTLKMNILTNNVISRFIAEDYDKIINTLKKYQNKRIGEKTKEKMREDIKNLNDLYAFVYIHHGYYSWDCNNWTVSIELKNETYAHSRVKIKIEFQYYNNAYQDSNGYVVYVNGHKKDSYTYRHNIDALVNDIINDYNKTRQEIDELKKQANDKIDLFREKYPYNLLGNSNDYEFKHII